jgi:hypothetical protein
MHVELPRQQDSPSSICEHGRMHEVILEPGGRETIRCCECGHELNRVSTDSDPKH